MSLMQRSIMIFDKTPEKNKIEFLNSAYNDLSTAVEESSILISSKEKNKSINYKIPEFYWTYENNKIGYFVLTDSYSNSYNLKLNKDLEETEFSYIKNTLETNTILRIFNKYSKHNEIEVHQNRTFNELEKKIILEYNSFESIKLIHNLLFSALFHDIGKNDQDIFKIISKKVKLSSEDYELQKSHPIISYNMLKSLSNKNMSLSKYYILYHHLLPKGYPNHKNFNESMQNDCFDIFENIKELRFLSQADIYSALNERRPYIINKTNSDILKEINLEFEKIEQFIENLN